MMSEIFDYVEGWPQLLHCSGVNSTMFLSSPSIFLPQQLGDRVRESKIGLSELTKVVQREKGQIQETFQNSHRKELLDFQAALIVEDFYFKTGNYNIPTLHSLLTLIPSSETTKRSKF